MCGVHFLVLSEGPSQAAAHVSLAVRVCSPLGPQSRQSRESRSRAQQGAAHLPAAGQRAGGPSCGRRAGRACCPRAPCWACARSASGPGSPCGRGAGLRQRGQRRRGGLESRARLLPCRSFGAQNRAGCPERAQQSGRAGRARKDSLPRRRATTPCTQQPGKSEPTPDCARRPLSSFPPPRAQTRPSLTNNTAIPHK